MAHLSVKSYAVVSAAIFAVVAILHLVRLVGQAGMEFGGWDVPMWASVAGLVVAGYLAFEGFHLA